MKLYMVSGMGAGYEVLSLLKFPADITPVYLPWLQPAEDESLTHYAKRMAANIPKTEPCILLGYSFGGIVVQEMAKELEVQKIIILASIKSETEKKRLFKIKPVVRYFDRLPTGMFNTQSARYYAAVRRWIDPKNPNLLKYFTQRDPYYLKWCAMQVLRWENKTPSGKVIQIMGDRDIVFPIERCKPDYVIKNGTHLFPITRFREVNEILATILG